MPPVVESLGLVAIAFAVGSGVVYAHLAERARLRAVGLKPKVDETVGAALLAAPLFIVMIGFLIRAVIET